MSTRELSKLLSYALRHRPDDLGLTLDARGFTPIDALAAAAAARLGSPVSAEDIRALAASSDDPAQKRRFELEGDRVRAGHGHSFPIEGYRPSAVSGPLYHAAPRAVARAILEGGLLPMKRDKVHLSSDRAITVEAAKRKSGDVALFELDADSARAAGVGIYESADPRVFLSDAVPATLLKQIA